MDCQIKELDGLLLQAEYANMEFYRTAIRRMQQTVQAFNAHALAAATAVRSSKT